MTRTGSPGSTLTRRRTSPGLPLLDRDGDPGVVIAEGFHRRPDRFIRLLPETFEPQPIDRSFANQSIGKDERLPDVFQDIPLDAFHDDLDRFGGGQRKCRHRQEQYQNYGGSEVFKPALYRAFRLCIRFCHHPSGIHCTKMTFPGNRKASLRS